MKDIDSVVLGSIVATDIHAPKPVGLRRISFGFEGFLRNEACVSLPRWTEPFCCNGVRGVRGGADCAIGAWVCGGGSINSDFVGMKGGGAEEKGACRVGLCMVLYCCCRSGGWA